MKRLPKHQLLQTYVNVNVLFTTGELDDAGEDVVFTPDDFYEHLNHVIYQVIVSSLGLFTVMYKTLVCQDHKCSSARKNPCLFCSHILK